MLGFVYFADNKGKTPSNVDTAVKVAASVGTMVGQFAFGYLADRVGRKRMYGLELIIIIVATIGQSLSGSGPAVSVWAAIVFWRLILGIGIGGDYPLSAVITSEFATTKRRGAMMAAVFAMQGFGILAAAIVALLVLLGYKSAIQYDVNYLDQVWRIVIGLGCVPAVGALYFRLTIPETPRYTMDIEQKVNKGAKDATAFLERGAAAGDYSDAEAIAKAEVPQASWSDFWAYFGQWQNGKILLGTAYSWFALDIAWYGLGLNNSFILQTIQFSGGVDAYTTLYNTVVGNIIINLLGSVPGKCIARFILQGNTLFSNYYHANFFIFYFCFCLSGYWVTVFTVERIGRKPIQIGGFTMLTILFIILGFGYNAILSYSPALFLVLFTLAQLFFNFGPNSTTFIVPGEVFPTRYRSTGHGISAASGKFGAVVAQVGFGVLKDIGGTNQWIDHLLQIFAFFMLTGIFSSLLIPETTGRSLEDLSNEDQTNYVHHSDEK